jgi:DNA-binding MarR family transcriptional regulator
MREVVDERSGPGEVQALARFRSEIRRFLRFSEKAAAAAGLEAQQHQLLLQVAGAPEKTLTTISYVADAMCLQHHTAVELSTRCEAAGLIRKVQDADDRRRVVLRLTARGRKALRGLSQVHAEQLRELAPVLIQALTRISRAKRPARTQTDRDGGEGVRS